MEFEIDKFSKNIYNTFLKIRAKYNNRPFRFRKNFDKFDKVNEILKLKTIFEKYSHIDMELFFSAPYEIWDTSTDYDLAFYTKKRALTCYVNYKKYLVNLDPDTEYHIKKVIYSFYFIKEFCLSKGITINEYLNHETGIYSFLTHLKNDNVSIYALFEIDGFKNKFRDNVDSELKNFLYSDLYINYDNMYRKYMTSKKCREIAKKCLQKIK